LPYAAGQECSCAKSLARVDEQTEAIMKALFFSMALGIGLALWGAEPQAGVDQLMAAGKLAGEQIYSILH
jgi:hypothetical protein